MNDSRYLSTLARWVIGIILAICIAFYLIWCFGGRVNIEGGSMSPSLSSGESVLINRITYKFSTIDRFDIICFNNDLTNKPSVKRVVGLPGETIKISDGIIYVNGSHIDYPISKSKYNLSGLAEDDFMLGEDEYFVLGDNGDSSEDSRFKSVGAVKEKQIEGKVWFRLSPFGFID